MGIEIRHKSSRNVLLEVDADTLEGANLTGTNLASADLFRANLFAARLDGANLEFADLCGADLRRSVLTGANLTRANLYGADLSRADVRRADLSRSILSCADLRKAIYDARTRWPAGFDVVASEAVLEGALSPTSRSLSEVAGRVGDEPDEHDDSGREARSVGRALNRADEAPETVQPARVGIGPTRPVLELPLDKLDPDPQQPRKLFSEDSLQSLAESIRSQGLLQPIVVRPGPEGRYHIVAGERRYRASRLAGLETITAVVHNFDADHALMVALVENLHRDDLTDIEKSDALVHLKEITGKTWDQLAGDIHLSVDRVKALAGLQALAEPVKEMVRFGRLSGRQARAIRPLPVEEQEALALEVLEKSLSAETIRVRVQRRVGRFPIGRGGARATELGATGTSEEPINYVPGPLSSGPVGTTPGASDGPGLLIPGRVPRNIFASGSLSDGVLGLRETLTEATLWLRSLAPGELSAEMRARLVSQLDEIRNLLVRDSSG